MKLYVRSSALDMSMFAGVYEKRMKEVESAAKRIAKKNGLKVNIQYDVTPVSDIMGEMNIDVYDGVEYVTSIIVNAYKNGWSMQSPNTGKIKMASHEDVIDGLERLFWSVVN